MTTRSVGYLVPQYSTAMLTLFVSEYGPAGSVEVGSLEIGELVFDKTVGKVKYFNGTDFVLITA